MRSLKRVEMTAALGSGSAPRPPLPQPWASALPLLLGSGPSPFEATRQPSSGRPKAEDLRPKPLTGRGHYEFTHLDPDCGFLAVLSGRKRVRLWPSHLVHELYPNPLGADGRTIQSAVDLTLDLG